ncbi:MAG: hypothetical protein HY924_02075 [Elusimicrobia bacterium]|nr:hypothetical protein [Elusimicrobiota bacterium]
MEFTKATVTWPEVSPTSNLAFAVTYGKQTTICATVNPPRLASKFVWDDPAGALTVIPGTDPSCNEGQGGFLAIQARTNSVGGDCSISDRSIVAKLHGKVVSTAQGKIMRPTGTSAILYSIYASTTEPYGLGSWWHLNFNSADALPEVAPDFDGLMATEDLDIIDLNAECGVVGWPEATGDRIGPPNYPHNAVDDNNALFFPDPLPNCRMVFRQFIKIGNCKTPDVSIAFQFDENSVLAITRSDGNKPATPSTTP